MSIYPAAELTTCQLICGPVCLFTRHYRVYGSRIKHYYSHFHLLYCTLKNRFTLSLM